MEMDDALTKKECVKAAKAIKPLAKKRFPEARIVRVEVTGSDDSYDNHPWCGCAWSWTRPETHCWTCGP